MQLWQIDIVGGLLLVDPVTGELREAKVVTGVDDHSRFCVIATVVERATSRAVCLALAAALRRFGALGRAHAQQTVTVAVCETTLAVELADGDVHVIRRTTTQRCVGSRHTDRGRLQSSSPGVACQPA